MDSNQALADTTLANFRRLLDEFHSLMASGQHDSDTLSRYAYELYDRADSLDRWLSNHELPEPTDWRRSCREGDQR